MNEIMERQRIKLGAARFDFSVLATLSVHVDFVWATLQVPFHAFIVLHHCRFEISLFEARIGSEAAILGSPALSPITAMRFA